MKRSAVTVLRDLVTGLETETGGLTEDQALLLFDVCQALGMTDTDAHYVLGDSLSVVTEPYPLQGINNEAGL